MELGHLLTRSGVTYPEASSEVCHNSFCQFGSSVSLHWVQRLKVAILPLDLPCSGPVTHSGEIFNHWHVSRKEQFLVEVNSWRIEKRFSLSLKV